MRRDEPGRGEKAKGQRAPSGKSRSKGQLARRKILIVQRVLSSHTPPRRREVSFSREAAFFCFPFFKLKNLRAISPPDFFFFLDRGWMHLGVGGAGIAASQCGASAGLRPSPCPAQRWRLPPSPFLTPPQNPLPPPALSRHLRHFRPAVAETDTK